MLLLAKGVTVLPKQPMFTLKTRRRLKESQDTLLKRGTVLLKVGHIGTLLQKQCIENPAGNNTLHNKKSEKSMDMLNQVAITIPPNSEPIMVKIEVNRH